MSDVVLEDVLVAESYVEFLLSFAGGSISISVSPENFKKILEGLTEEWKRVKEVHCTCCGQVVP